MGELPEPVLDPFKRPNIPSLETRKENEREFVSETETRLGGLRC